LKPPCAPFLIGSLISLLAVSAGGCSSGDSDSSLPPVSSSSAVTSPSAATPTAAVPSQCSVVTPEPQRLASGVFVQLPPKQPIAHQGLALAELSPDGQFALTTGADSQLKLWAVPSGTLVRTAKVTGDVIGMAFSPDGKTVILGTSGGGLSFVSFPSLEQSGQVPDSKPAKTFRFVVLLMPANGLRLLAQFDTQTVSFDTRLYSLADRKLIEVIPSELGLAFGSQSLTADERQALAYGRSGALETYNMTDGSIGQSISGAAGRPFLGGNPPGASAMNRDHSTFGVIGPLQDNDTSRLVANYRSVRLYSLPTGNFLMKVDMDSQVARFAFSPDGSKLATGSDRVIKVWSIPSGQAIATVADPSLGLGYAKFFGFSEDGRSLIWADQDAQLRIISAVDGTGIARFALGDTAWAGLRLTHDGQFLLAVNNRNSTVSVWDLKNLTLRGFLCDPALN